MRMLGIVGCCLIAAGLALAADTPAKKEITAVSTAEAKAALAEFEPAFKTKDPEAKLEAVYTLHDVPHDLVIARLARLLKNRDPQVRNVAAMALGGQRHNVTKAGKEMMAAFKKDYRNEDVVSSVLDGMGELPYLNYWPQLTKCLDDDRNAVAIRALDLIGKVKDWRAIPELLKLYKEQMPKGYKWSTGEVKVDTGAAGTADADAAKAKFNAKYGAGGSKMKAKAKAKANSGKERNLTTQLRRCVRELTGTDFETVLDFEDWLMENYIEVARKAAVLDGKDPNAAAVKAKAELPRLKKKIEEERKRGEREMEEHRKQRDSANKNK